LARRTSWEDRIAFSVANNISVFGGSIMDLTEDQMSLYRWGVFLYNAHSLPPDERPSNDELDNDYLLGQWMKRRSQKEREFARNANSRDSLDESHSKSVFHQIGKE
jgi:hypothetical protein